MKRLLKPLALGLVCLLLLTTATAAFADSFTDKRQGEETRSGEGTVMTETDRKFGNGQNDQRPPMDGNALGGENGQNDQRPPMNGSALGGENGQDGQNGQHPPMNGNDPMHAVLGAVDALADSETKTALKTLLNAYRDAIDAERNAALEDREAAAAAVSAARDAVNAALREAGIDAQIGGPGGDERPPMPSQGDETSPQQPTGDDSQR